MSAQLVAGFSLLCIYAALDVRAVVIKVLVIDPIVLLFYLIRSLTAGRLPPAGYASRQPMLHSCSIRWWRITVLGH